ncbi:hypothetical protein [Sporosarcina sp. HYO08]|uniref:hypothetical protein n=1 Tax=Sporosarcina sp. HYO08 TaxID=1759557 RepID=UPI000797C1C3|nr:hypothetical protein [Sporosarcina sp. HYO08]KXH80757.1 hypothetical protein AU377_08425 [Sporosarcina sp. HYO08]
MMNFGHNPMQQGHGMQGHGMQGHGMQPIVCPPIYRCHNTFVKREVPVIQPIVNVNRVNTVVTPRRYFQESNRNVMGDTFFAGPTGMGPTGVSPAGMGPGFGPGQGHGHGCGCGCGGGRRRWWR